MFLPIENTKYVFIMTNMSKKAEGFSIRLKEAMDDMGIASRGRQMLLAREFHVSQPSAKRWLDGENFPDTEKIVELAEWSKTSIDWLLTGRGTKHPIEFGYPRDVLDAMDCLLSMSESKQNIAIKLIKALKSDQ